MVANSIPPFSAPSKPQIYFFPSPNFFVRPFSIFLTIFLHHSIISISHELGDIKKNKILGALNKKKLGEEEEIKRSLLQVLVTTRLGPLSSLTFLHLYLFSSIS
jgi:hypothetical protein